MAQSSERGAHGQRTAAPEIRVVEGPPTPSADTLPLADQRTLQATVGDGTPAAPAVQPTLASRLPQVARESYEVWQEVAQGGIGRVLRARDQRLDRPVALKELLVWNEAQEQRFVREALLTARLQHPAIVPIYEAGRWPDGEPFYAMKLVSGRSLADLIAERTDFAERLALLPHVLTAARAVAYAHSKRILHRDLKPANVLVGEFGETVVIDWGLAKDLAEQEPPADLRAVHVARTGEHLTLQGSIVGTPAYMPPEQAAGAAVDERADVYALGAMLYHVLAAVAPYHDVAPARLLTAIAEAPPRRIEALVPRLSDDLAAIINKAMARDPAVRYETAMEMAEDLERFQTGQIVAAHSYKARELLRRYWRRNRPALSIAALALVLLALVLLAAFLKTDRERRLAQLAEVAAVDARHLAEEARTQATSRADDMTLLQAEDALGRDPNRALAWLKTLSPEFGDAARVRRIAADAHARGIARTFHGHTEYVNRFGISADGARLVTASDDKTARVWDLATGASQVLTGHTDEVWNAMFSPTDDEIVSVSKDSTLRTWDPHTGAPRLTIPLPAKTRQLVYSPDGDLLGGVTTGPAWLRRPGAAEVEQLSEDRPYWTLFSQDGTRLIVQPQGGEAHVRELTTGRTWQLPGTASTPGRWSLDHRGRVALHQSERTTSIWSVEAGTHISVPTASHTRRPVFTSNGDLVAFAVDSDIHVHDTHTGALAHEFVGHAASVQAVEFSHDDRMLVSGAVDRTVRTWHLDTGRGEVYAGFEGLVTEIAVLPDDRSILAVSGAGEIRVFEPRLAGKILTDHGAPTTGLALAADDRLASIDDRGDLRIRDLEGRVLAEHTSVRAPGIHLLAAPDGRSFAGAARAWIVDVDGRIPDTKAPPATLLLGTFDATPPRTVPLSAAVHDLVWLADGSAVLLALQDGTVRRIDRAGEVAELHRFAAPATSVAASADGAWISAGSEGGAMYLADPTTGRPRALVAHKDRVTTLAFSPDGAWLASGCADHTIRLWRLADASFRSFDEGGHGVEQVGFAPDGATLILLSGGETQLRRLDLATGRHIAPLAGRRGKLLGFTIAADGRRLLGLGDDGSVRLIDMTDGDGRTLVGHTDAITGAGFAAGGRTIVTLGREGTVRAWPDDLPETMAGLRAWIDAATPERVRRP